MVCAFYFVCSLAQLGGQTAGPILTSYILKRVFLRQLG